MKITRYFGRQDRNKAALLTGNQDEDRTKSHSWKSHGNVLTLVRVFGKLTRNAGVTSLLHRGGVFVSNANLPSTCRPPHRLESPDNELVVYTVELRDLTLVWREVLVPSLRATELINTICEFCPRKLSSTPDCPQSHDSLKLRGLEEEPDDTLALKVQVETLRNNCGHLQKNRRRDKRVVEEGMKQFQHLTEEVIHDLCCCDPQGAEPNTRLKMRGNMRTSKTSLCVALFTMLSCGATENSIKISQGTPEVGGMTDFPFRREYVTLRSFVFHTFYRKFDKILGGSLLSGEMFSNVP
uniref:Uncharacterized protein n=1 Tax=Timema bartmani TaxID=61472 RepID=A0A7R9ESP4_9NEOP|nr:unnamed protein product [Timema bartmani]